MCEDQVANKAMANQGLIGASLNRSADRMDLRVNRIEDGYLITTMGCKDGEFFEKQYFDDAHYNLGYRIQELYQAFDDKAVAAVTTPSQCSDDDVPF